jgi:hypothetical protein
MMKRTLILAVLTGFASFSHAQTAFNGADGTDPLNLAKPLNWTAGLPRGTEATGSIDINGTLTGTGQGRNLFNGGTITVGSGAVLTATEDIAARDTTWIFNSSTVNVTDDIFSDNGSFTFNAGSHVTVGDDFATTGETGSITINGGTFDVGGIFGTQSGGTLNFFGGSVTAGKLRFSSSTNIGGSATASAAESGALDGRVNILPGWTGSLTLDNGTAAEWKAILTSGWTLNNVAVDAASFAANFYVDAKGKLTTIPEPSMTAFLMAFGTLAIVGLRRRSRRD